MLIQVALVLLASYIVAAAWHLGEISKISRCCFRSERYQCRCRVARRGAGLYHCHFLVDVKLTVSHVFFVASLCFMMGYGSRVRADESTYLGNYIIAASYGDDESLVDILPIRFGEGPATRSLRVGLAMSIYPHYPDSRQFETAIAPFPYAEYHSDRIELDQDGLAAKLFQSNRFELDLSINDDLPVSSKNNDLMTWIVDLALRIELEPEREITLATWGNSILRFDIPARANFEVTTRHVLSQALYGPVRPTKLNFTPPRPKI